MKLTSFTDYSMRVLLFAASNGNKLSSIREVSEAHNISSNHLMKVVHHLGKGGYLETIRGKNGGFRLGMMPKDIIVGELIRYTEEELEIVNGINEDNNEFDVSNNASFATVMKGSLDAFFEVADSYTLADLINDERPVPIDVAS